MKAGDTSYITREPENREERQSLRPNVRMLETRLAWALVKLSYMDPSKLRSNQHLMVIYLHVISYYIIPFIVK